MSSSSCILLVLALVLLSTQCSYAYYGDQGYGGMSYPDYGNQQLNPNYGCIAEGFDCENRYTDCCLGVCRCQTGLVNCYCQTANIYISQN